MKQLKILIAGLALLFTQGVFAQATCISQVVTYNGPENSTELSDRLYYSSNSILQNMNTATKAAIIAHVVFENGLPSYIDEANSYIEAIDNDGNANAIWSAVFDCPIFTCSYETKPSITNISFTDFMTLYNSDPSLYAYRTAISKCENCKKTPPMPCCEVGGTGCFDNYTEIILSGDRYHVIID